MSELKPKFIIEDGSLIIGKVVMHYDLCTDPSKVKGGGLYRYSEPDNKFIFYGFSFDFGEAKIEDVKEAIQSGKVYSDINKRRCIADRHDWAFDDGIDITPISVLK
jgi:hypothetical protein